MKYFDLLVYRLKIQLLFNFSLDFKKKKKKKIKKKKKKKIKFKILFFFFFNKKFLKFQSSLILLLCPRRTIIKFISHPNIYIRHKKQKPSLVRQIITLLSPPKFSGTHFAILTYHYIYIYTIVGQLFNISLKLQYYTQKIQIIGPNQSLQLQTTKLNTSKNLSVIGYHQSLFQSHYRRKFGLKANKEQFSNTLYLDRCGNTAMINRSPTRNTKKIIQILNQIK
eukprot:TRINITY_DN12501_c0_g2_i3.p1 TRINITY_DN12501_c0_g2~~TRINITY_DN12501_c0_g2_i3.p1  ORF type:complete len:223 (+),score=-7.36 TRINITY_DN12501_c0_g2_i3:200-868(+)